MNDECSDSHIPRTHSDFEKAVQRYAWVVAIAALCAFGLFDLCLWLPIVWFGPHLLAGPFPEFTGPLALVTVSAAVSIAFLIVVVRRARRNPILHCAYCDQSVANFQSNNHVLATGKCPHCEHHLFEGSLTTSDEAVQRLEKLERAVRGHLRFAVAACVIGLVAAYAIILWMKSTAPQTREINWIAMFLLPLAIFPLLIGTMWLAARMDISRAQRHARAMQDVDRDGST